MGMKHRKLRIVWSVAWGLSAAILASVLVLSYFYVATMPVSAHYYVEAYRGWLFLNPTIGTIVSNQSGSSGGYGYPVLFQLFSSPLLGCLGRIVLLSARC